MPPNSVCLQKFCTSNFLIDLKCLEEMSNHRQALDTRQNHSVPDEQQSTAQIKFWVSSQETSVSIQDTKVIFGDQILLSQEG